MKTFSLYVEQGASRYDSGLMFCAANFLRESVPCTASLERTKLCGVPAEALSSLHIGPDAVSFRERIQAELPSLYSAGLLLENLDMLLRTKNDFGIPLRSVDMKMDCGKLTPMPDHSALLAVWKDFVEEDVTMEYFRDGVDMSGDEDGDDNGEAGGAGSCSCDSEWERLASVARGGE